MKRRILLIISSVIIILMVLPIGVAVQTSPAPNEPIINYYPYFHFYPMIATLNFSPIITLLFTAIGFYRMTSNKKAKGLFIAAAFANPFIFIIYPLTLTGVIIEILLILLIILLFYFDHSYGSSNSQ